MFRLPSSPSRSPATTPAIPSASSTARRASSRGSTRISSELIAQRRTESDLRACEALLDVVHRADSYPSSWPTDVAAWLTPRGLLDAWIVRRDQTIVGHVVLGAIDTVADTHLAALSRRAVEEVAEIKRLFVAPAARRMGAGRLLLDVAARAAESLALHPLIEVTAEKTAAIRLYESTGWRRIGTSVATWRRASGERPLLYQYARDAEGSA